MMIEIGAWLVAIVVAVLAGVLSAADSALLAFHASDKFPVSETAFADRERKHRALSMARVVAYVTAGAALASALNLASMAYATRVVAMIVTAVLGCTLTEGVGRAVGYANPAAVFARLQPLIEIVSRVLRPAVSLGGGIERALHLVIPPTEPDDEERETHAEQFREVVAAEAEVSSAEEELIHGVFSLGETEVHEIMVPRVDIVGIDATTPWSEVLDRIRSSEHARFPVFRETLDDVSGILYAKDVLPAIVAEEEEPESGWLSLVRPAAFIPTSKGIDAQLREFQASRTHIAIVSDEYGGTAGLITIEDILEEIVGEIRDEHDIEEPPIEQEGTSRFWVSGSLTIDELSDRINVDFGIDDVTTVGGLVYALFGRVPRSGESLTRAGMRIVVERVRRRRIERVYFERLEPVSTPGGERE
jgi:magnesium and cobalt exporter, CNNM family